MDRVTVAAKYPRLGALIRQARKEANLSHDRLAEKVGTSRQHLIRLEHGYHMPSEAMLAAISRETGKDSEFFETQNADDDDEEAAVRKLSTENLLRVLIGRAATA